MSDLYYQWFDRIGGPTPSIDRTARKYIAGTKKRRFEQPQSCTKRRKIECQPNSKQDESWIDDLLLVVGDSDGKDVVPESQSRFNRAPVIPRILHDVVADALSNLVPDDTDSLLGDFSQIFSEERCQDLTSDTSGPYNSSVECTRAIPETSQIKSQSIQARATASCDPCTPMVQALSGNGSAVSSIDSVRCSKQPMLFTLTSFPFRIIHANNAFHKLTQKKNVIGEPFHSVFVQEAAYVPSIAACPTLEGKFHEDIVRISSNTRKNGLFCKIQVRPVLKKMKPSELGLRYHVVTLEKLEVPSESTSSIIYMPMPSGSLALAR